MTTAQRKTLNSGLTFLALLSFTAAFFAARIFTTITPDTVVVSGGIHFHHFWYGLAMVVASGWLGIAYNHPALRRVYAVVFGFGGGLIGDEVGLLLTFGNYQSQLTYLFFIGLVCFVILATLLIRFRTDLVHELSEMERGEVVVHIGLVVALASALPFAFGFLLVGAICAFAGVALAAVGAITHRQRNSSIELKSAGGGI
ncbi:MAG TPA: hypothetical protein VGS04_01695 [Nitrososphaerales archaeon]|nr:hypothetical protein [Nitrososphaerales archaeon]